VRPSIGDRIVVYPSATFALSTAACCATTCARAFDRGLVGFDCRRCRVGQAARLLGLIFRDDAARVQLRVAFGRQLHVLGARCVTRELRFRLAEKRHIALEVRIGLIDLGLERPWIDREEKIAFSHEVALVEMHLGELSGHLRAYADRRVRFHVADAVDVDRDIALRRLPDDDGYGPAFGAAAARRRS